jgi:uncharacterized membrane protein
MKSTFGIFKFFIPFIILVLFLSYARAIYAQQTSSAEEKMEALITSVKEEKQITLNEKNQLYQKLEVRITEGRLKNKKITIENGNFPATNIRKYEKGDKVIVTASKGIQGTEVFYITDYVRRGSIYLLFGLFAVLAIIIGGKRGFASLIGMGLSFAIIFLFILPQISNGKDPIAISIIAALFIIPITFYLSHGINRKTTVAVIGTITALILTGFASEEASFLQAAKPGLVNIQALILAGIIIGVLGVLDDITIAQAGIVYQLKEVSPKIEFKELYLRAMNIGKDHISSMVNTLVLVYTGAALPLLLLFINNPQPFSQLINFEIIAEEIIRTLVASIGLILAVPITTFLAAIAIDIDILIKEDKD